ncbi:ribonuclease R [Mesorhizobium sp. Root554]|uniref:ribonuclease R n=1 Tax=unclassified Mesorhizobium TaxID=325217 RepID=UPI0006FC1A3F|nr:MULTISPECIES: ribonuclease R [unclassified Mesorhizobium]KQZ13054.1 ribonuclease R [Mesorhizobium sp. Root1471]KQZ35572.1 ribonuclease R [Mesorhizobium sp. Root554]
MARRISGKSNRDPRAADTRRGAQDTYRPSRDEILRYIAENPDRSGKRDIAKAFSLRGDDRIWLKDLLRDLADEGLLEKSRKRHVRVGALPHVTVLDVFGRDPDGGLLARPAEYKGDNPPIVAIRVSRSGPAPGIGARVLAKTFPTDDPDGPAYTARIVKIFEKRDEAVLGVFRVLQDGSFRIEPVERRQPELIVDKEFQNGAKNGDLVEVEPARAGKYGLPRARVLSVLGSLTSEKAVSMIAIHAHDIPHIFPPEVLAESEALKPVTLDGREDWRELPLVTIDPADAKDHDDAVFALPDADEKNRGGVIVTVAIADVSAYVRPNSALDREALKRGNSVYFPDRVVPMLPERISNNLCSLREGEDRPAMAVRMTFSAEGRKLRHTFHRVMMKSAARLVYPQAQAAIDGAPDDKTGPILDTVLRPLWDAYAILKRGRDARQPLELDLPERKILLKEDGTVDCVIVPERLDAHKLIEEFMIQANVAAAETLENKKQALVYRIHDAPSLAKQESLREFLQTLSLSLARGAQMRPSQFNGILERVRGADNEQLVNEVVLRSQSQAEYSPANIGHFGLNLLRYAHFTSPIRRYADLIVHRALVAALGLGPGGLTRDEEARLEETAVLISASERRAMAAERDTIDRLIAAYLAERIDERFDARISGVTKAGLFVKLPQYGADGFIPVSTLGDDYYIYDEAARSLFGERSGKGYQLADHVEVRLVEVAPMAGAMRFEMLSDPKPLPGSKRSFHKAKGRARASQPRSRGRRR